MRVSLITKIVQSARGMIERALVRKEIKKPRLSQNFQISPGKLKNLVTNTVETHFDTQEADAFRMKAISLLHPLGFFDTIQEKISSIQLAPLFKQPHGENQITLSQVLQPFPGERIELRGTFQRKDNRTIPIANSFELQRISQVTGFPHPAQHTGWAFTANFLEDQSPLETIRKSLMPGEFLRQRAKNWVSAKRRAFDRNKVESCEHLKRFMETLNGNSSPFIDTFFDHAQQRQDCYDFICVTHAKILEQYNAGQEPAQGYMSLIYEVFKKRAKLESYKKCASYEFNQFLNCLKKDPPSQDEVLIEIYKSISSETSFLIKS